MTLSTPELYFYHETEHEDTFQVKNNVHIDLKQACHTSVASTPTWLST